MGLVNSKHIVFVTGCFVSHTGWNNWASFFAEKGYTCVAPPWRHKDATAEELRRRHPDAGIASNRLDTVLDQFTGIIENLPEKPILIGHSFGGLMTQILVNRGLAAAGVAIHSVPPKGVPIYELSVLRSIWQALGYFTSAKKSYLMSFKKWQYAFTNGMDLADQQKAYEENTVPESKLLARDGIGSPAQIDFSKPQAPLLIISGDADNIMPASLNLRNFKKYRESGSILEYKNFPGRNHFVLGLPTWKEEANYIAEWLECLQSTKN